MPTASGQRPTTAIGWLFLFAGLGTAFGTVLDQLSRFLGAIASVIGAGPVHIR